MQNQNTKVFVSYSHTDTSLVSPVVNLLRVNKSLVFQDIDRIQPGKRWRSEISKAIAESHLVVVFWCIHASSSNEVLKEWKAAIEQDKDLLPLLLDATPLPPELNEFQWIDFRGTVGANHNSSDLSENVTLSESPPSPRIEKDNFSLLGGSIVILTIMSLIFVKYMRQYDFVKIESPQFLWSVIFLGVMYIFWRLTYAKRNARKASRIAISQPNELELQIASKLEAEILRRIELSQNDGV